MSWKQRLKYERILNVEINKTSEMISKLVPFHFLNVIKNEKRQVDDFEDITLLYTDMVGFTEFSKNALDPKEVVNLLQKVFSRLDRNLRRYTGRITVNSPRATGMLLGVFGKFRISANYNTPKSIINPISATYNILI